MMLSSTLLNEHIQWDEMLFSIIKGLEPRAVIHKIVFLFISIHIAWKKIRKLRIHNIFMKMDRNCVDLLLPKILRWGIVCCLFPNLATLYMVLIIVYRMVNNTDSNFNNNLYVKYVICH